MKIYAGKLYYIFKQNSGVIGVTGVTGVIFMNDPKIDYETLLI
jgi:hypothetical protein